MWKCQPPGKYDTLPPDSGTLIFRRDKKIYFHLKLLNNSWVLLSYSGKELLTWEWGLRNDTSNETALAQNLDMFVSGDLKLQSEP